MRTGKLTPRAVTFLSTLALLTFSCFSCTMDPEALSQALEQIQDVSPLPPQDEPPVAQDPSQDDPRVGQGPVLPDDQAATITLENQVFRQDVRYTLNDDVLLVRDCTFEGASLKVRGKGDVIVERTVFDQPLTLGIMIMIEGSMRIHDVSIYGTGTSPNGNKYSGLTIHGATKGGLISDVLVSDFTGNGVLLEASIPIVGVTLRDVEVLRCAGGIWLFNSEKCVVNGFYATASNYLNKPLRTPGRVFTCVLDQWYVDGVRLQGDTVFSNVVCQ